MVQRYIEMIKQSTLPLQAENIKSSFFLVLCRTRKELFSDERSAGRKKCIIYCAWHFSEITFIKYTNSNNVLIVKKIDKTSKTKKWLQWWHQIIHTIYYGHYYEYDVEHLRVRLHCS
jgi:hypothetical protein